MAENGVSVSFEDLDNAVTEVERPDQPLAEETPGETKEETRETKTEKEETAKEEKEPETQTTEKEEEPTESKEDEVPEEPSDNAGRSKLGRRVSAIEASIQTLVDEMRTVLKPAENQETIESEEDTWLAENEDEDEFISKRDLPGLFEKFETLRTKKEAKVQKERDRYNAEYNAVFQEYGKSTDPELHKQIIDEMIANHNVKRSNNGSLDGELNYLKAKATIIDKKSAETTNPLEKNKDKDLKNLGGPSDTIATPKESAPIKLDKYAAEFVSQVGLSEDSIKKALEGKARPGLMGEHN